MKKGQISCDVDAWCPSCGSVHACVSTKIKQLPDSKDFALMTELSCDKCKIKWAWGARVTEEATSVKQWVVANSKIAR